MKKFKKGEKVIYGGHGIGVVKEIVEKEVMGRKFRFYEIFFEGSNSNIFIPVEKIDSAGLRKLVKSGDVDRILAEFKNLDDSVDLNSDWKSRYRDNEEKVKSGNIFKIAEVIRDLSILNSKKPLSMRERELLDKAKKMFVDEVSEVKKSHPSEIRAYLDSLFNGEDDLTL